MIPNPYAPPVEGHANLDFTRRGVTLIPTQLADRTRRIVFRFGLFEFVWPIITAYWTESLTIDLFAFFIASNGLAIRRSSFKRFPWTALLCCLYPIVFVVSLQQYDPSLVANWILSRKSPVLVLQLISSCWAMFAIAMILRCYTSHWRPKVELTEGFTSRPE